MLRFRQSVALIAFAATLSTGWSANFYQGVSPATLPWPGGIVPYVFTTNVSAAEQAVYLDGMREWGLSAGIQFVPWTTQTNHVILDFDYLQGTNTYYGSVPPVMTIDNLSRAQICHETGHLLGFQHEHVRIDRNNYITVNYGNIDTGTTTNSSGEGSGGVLALYQIDSNSTPYGAYDFESVMHYGRTLFSYDPATEDTVDPLPPYIYEYYNRIGNFALSVGDRAGAAHLYGPPLIALTNVVTNTADSGPGSLRAAIYYANDHPGTTVRFAIPSTDPGYGNGVYTLYVSGQLPPLVANGTVIDATSEPGYSGSPIVALDASKLLLQTEFTIGGIYIYAGNCTLRGLAIDNFTDSGINLLYNYCASNSVQGCYVGLSANGTTAEPNDYEGINIGVGARANVIGGTGASQRNVISGNSGYGITITDTNTYDNVVSGNYIGLNGSGTASVSNTYTGIGIFGGASSNVIGPGNVVSGNYNYGIYISDNNTIGNVVQGNFVGTDATGMRALPNSYMGVGVWNGAYNTLVGGTTASARNVISGNGNNGVATGFGVSGGNVIKGNYIGVGSNGLTAIPNNGAGVYVESSLQSNVIVSNAISGNASDGVFFYAATNDVVEDNYIGLGANGTTAVPNSQIGVYILYSPSNWIGGGNIVSGNANDGIQLWGEGTSYNTVEDNFIGTTKTGLTGAGNSGSGLSMIAGPLNNQITGNVVAANGNYGVAFEGAGTSGNVVQGNFIGVAADGKSPLGNTWQGVELDGGASGNIIGLTLTGSGAGNIIANNPYDGLILYDTNTVGNSIRGNSIYSNGTPAIFLVGSGESGPNDLESYPALTSAAVYTNTMVIAGTVSGAANRTILIDIYRNPAPDSSGYGQGQTFAGTATAQTDSAGTGSFSLPFGTRELGQYFSATATDSTTGNTSQFCLDLESTNKSGMGPGQLLGESYSSRTGFSFNITLATNENYSIQVATNLAVVPITWVNLTNFFATSPSNKITDAAATNSPVRFYRAVTP